MEIFLKGKMEIESRVTVKLTYLQEEARRTIFLLLFLLRFMNLAERLQKRLF